MSDELTSYNLFSSVKKSKIEWIWYPYIPCGKITILQREVLLSAAQKYIYVEPQRYVEWVEKVDMKIRPPKE